MDDLFELLIEDFKELLLSESLTEHEQAQLSSALDVVNKVYEGTMDRRLVLLTPEEEALAEELVPDAAEAIADAKERVRENLIVAGLPLSPGWKKLVN